MLKAKRIAKGVTQENLALALGVNQAAISKIESCERRIDIIELRDICNSMDISFIDFIVEAENTIKYEIIK